MRVPTRLSQLQPSLGKHARDGAIVSDTLAYLRHYPGGICMELKKTFRRCGFRWIVPCFDRASQNPYHLPYPSKPVSIIPAFDPCSESASSCACYLRRFCEFHGWKIVCTVSFDAGKVNISPAKAMCLPITYQHDSRTGLLYYKNTWYASIFGLIPFFLICFIFIGW